MARLEVFLQGALGADKYAKIFNDIPGQMPPTLSKDRTNRIILFNGCFYPPHRGHLALIEHIFHNCGEDLNVIAAVVLVASEEFLRWKFRRQFREFHLSEGQRTQLWEGELGHVNWCLVHPEEKWWGPSAKLQLDLERDGYKLEFVRIAGGDKIGISGQAHGQWSCQKLITSNICRGVDFFQDGNDSPLPLRNHGPWRKVEVDEEVLQDWARQRVLYLHHTSTDIAEEPGPETAQYSDIANDEILASRIHEEYLRGVSVVEKRKLWICDCTSNSRGYTLRFIASEEHLSPDLSSTNLRDIITCTPVSELEEKIRGIGLSPALLTRFVLERYGIM